VRDPLLCRDTHHLCHSASHGVLVITHNKKHSPVRSASNAYLGTHRTPLALPGSKQREPKPTRVRASGARAWHHSSDQFVCFSWCAAAAMSLMVRHEALMVAEQSKTGCRFEVIVKRRIFTR
jgi:hypothetical protein